MKEVFYIQKDEYQEDGNDTRIIAFHETLSGAVSHFNDIVEQEKPYFMYDETTSTDCSEEAMEDAGIAEMYHEDADGTRDYHIWNNSGWHEVYIHLFRKEVLD
jgi:hypothetical protein